MNKTVSNNNNLQVIHEDNHIIIINKRAGDIVQGDKTKDTPLSDIVKQYLKKKHNKPGKVFLGVVHRLDRPTTGIVLFAKTSKALTRLNKLFSERKAKKTYWALVKNEPVRPSDSLVHWLKKNSKNNKSTAYTKKVTGSKKAILHYTVLKHLEHYVLLEVNLETGRHHQIRCQLAAIGHPVKGDLKYRFNRSNPDGSIHLHAKVLEFVHPIKKKCVKVNAPLPVENLWQSCK